MQIKRWSKTLVKVYQATKSMFSIVSKPAIAVIQLQQHITPNTTQNIRINLEHLPKKLKALVLLVNCQSGSPAQALIIKNMIKRKAKQREVPIYAFGQEVCLSTGLLLLSTGNHTYLQKATIVGSGGLQKWNVDIEQFFKLNYGIEKVGYVSSQSHLLGNQKSQSLSPLTFDDEDILNTMSEVKRQELRTIISGFQDKIWKFVPSNSNAEQLKSNQLITSQEAVKRGLAQEIGSFHEVLSRKYPNINIQYFSRMPFHRIYNKLI